VTRPPEPDLSSISTRDIVVPASLPSRLDPVVHEPMRLAIAVALARNPALTFTELKRMFQMTDGNLTVHARRLEEVGYVAAERTGRGPARRTEYRLTPAGRRALEHYLDDLEAIVRVARNW
jgi:DNA-binding MarR family transcriptional regulator